MFIEKRHKIVSVDLQTGVDHPHPRDVTEQDSGSVTCFPDSGRGGTSLQMSLQSQV